jgi:hypothetical protein
VSGLPCITVPQPTASLVAERVVWALPRPKPAPAGLVGGRLLIHAGARRWGYADCEDSTGRPYSTRVVDVMRATGKSYYEASSLPLGAVVASATLTACLPIKSPPDSAYGCVYYGHRGLWIWGGEVDPPRDISDQLPYGDWSPGGWAWLLDDVAPTTERCPWCWGQGWVHVSNRFGTAAFGEADCRVCAGAGRCDPVPARGRPGVWRWKP